jgi:hypothetical protein
VAAIIRMVRLTAAESFWYVLGCISFGAMYLAKVPAKKALSEVGLAQMTSAERFWYVLQCVAFGAGYLAKVPLKKALTEIPYVPAPRPDQDSLADTGWNSWTSQPRSRHARPPEPHQPPEPLRSLPAPRHAHHDQA